MLANFRRKKVCRRKGRAIESMLQFTGKNRMLKWAEPRKITKTNYNLGDLVLVSHPMVKKGQLSGLAPRYYGPFTTVRRYKNGCVYLFKDKAKSHAKAKQIHVNNLKTYFDRAQPDELVRTQRTRSLVQRSIKCRQRRTCKRGNSVTNQSPRERSGGKKCVTTRDWTSRSWTGFSVLDKFEQVDNKRRRDREIRHFLVSQDKSEQK